MKRFTVLLAFFALVGFALQAQNVQITGNVTGADDGSALPGVSVVVKGTTIGTVTDFNGNYNLSVPASATTLVFSFVGMEPTELAISGRTTIDIALNQSSLDLEEVVVTSLGIKRDAKALGYSVQSVSNEDITRTSNADVVNALSSKLAGVQVTSSGGTAGASSYITIRGAASILGDNQPLFVVDGLPIVSGGGGGDVGGVATSGRTVELNPEEIESMTVLKGGAATALYGIQAANGAIIVTTKKGTDNAKAQFDFSSSVTIENVSQLPPRQDVYGQGWDGNWIAGYAQAWGPKISESSYTFDPAVWTHPLMDLQGALVPTSNPNGYELEGPAQSFDAYDYFQTGITYNNNLSVRSGNEKNKFYASVGSYNQEGVVPSNTFDKLNLRMNASSKVAKNLEIGANTSYIHSSGNFIQQGSNVSGVMLGLLRTPPSWDNSAGWKLPNGTQRTYRNGAGYDNPYWVSNEITFLQDVDRFMGNVTAQWDATDWFNVTYNLGTDLYMRRYQDYFPVYSRAKTAGYLGEYENYSQVLNSDLLFNFKKDINEDISARLTLGHNMYSTYSKNVFASANGLEIPGFIQVSNTSTQNASTGIYEYRTMAVFADLQFDLYRMLYFGFTGRNDWATTMPEDNLSTFYPSANMGFIFTELGALKDNSVLSFGKIRASYAVTANIAAAYSTKTNFVQAGAGDGWTDGLVFPLLGNAGFTLSGTLGNEVLQHENMITQEIGVELKFLQNRLGIDVGLFKNLNEDLLLYVPIATSTGYAQMYMNAGSMESKGIEIMFNATPVKTSAFSWDIFANFTKMSNTVTELAPGVEDVFLGGFTDPQIRAVAGEEYRTIYGFDYYRDDNGAYIINDDPGDGYPDGFPMTNNEKMVPLGTVNPDWLLNITNSFNFKGIGLTALLDIKQGGLMYNGTRFTMNTFGTSLETVNREVTYNADGSIDLANTPAENLVVYDGVLGHIASDGSIVSSGTVNTMPVVNDARWFTGEGGNFGGGATDGAIDDASWVRLREISVSYTLPKSVLGKTFIESAQIYVSGRNLWLKTPYVGIDPETNLQGANNSQGMDYFNMPGTKSVTFGVRIGL
ncbi:MAG: SusC/RagA family TonB-linked outer membrane protein [Bacteroidales bacterium]|nr:SusC/RagA family TonB-linked outer membrane protein [Bacteroidales bacterium]MCF8392026.1 SusC/RagA family TonB-linked outer membrane protein [Bacteroidales bacterium]